MAVNKVVYGGDTLIDLTGLTVTPDDVAYGTSFIDKTGAILTGAFIPEIPDVAVEEEHGVFTPTSNTTRPTIRFTNTHDRPPDFYTFVDTTGTANTTSNTLWLVSVINFANISPTGVAYLANSSTKYYGSLIYRHRSNSSNTVNTTSAAISSASATESAGNLGWLCTNTKITPVAGSTSGIYVRTGRKYTWSALWI